MSRLGRLGLAYDDLDEFVNALPKPQVKYNEKGGIYWMTPSGDHRRFLDLIARFGQNGVFTKLDPTTFHAILGQIYLSKNYSKTESCLDDVHAEEHNYGTDISVSELARYLLSHYDLDHSFYDYHVEKDVQTMLIVTNTNLDWLRAHKQYSSDITPEDLSFSADIEILQKEVFRKYLDRIWEGMDEHEREALVAAWKES